MTVEMTVENGEISENSPSEFEGYKRNVNSVF